MKNSIKNIEKCYLCGAEGLSLKIRGKILITKDNFALPKKVKSLYEGKILCYECLDWFE